MSLDVGGTLVRPWPSVGHVYARAGAPHGLRAAPRVLDAAFRAAWSTRDRRQRRGPDGRRWWRALVDRVLAEVGFTGDADACFEACYRAFSRAEAWQVHEDVFPALTALRGAGFSVGICSNWDGRLPALLEDLGIARFLDWQVISAFEALEKPDPRLFETVYRRAELPADAILHVGDQVEDDVLAARRAGLAAMRIDRQAPRPAADVLVDLRELTGRLMSGRPGGDRR